MKIVLSVLSLLLFLTAAAETAAPWIEAVEAADTDHDGMVSMNEVKEFPATGEFSGFQPFMADHFIDLDTDGDGMVNVEELKNGIMKMGMSPDEVAKGFRQGFSFAP